MQKMKVAISFLSESNASRAKVEDHEKNIQQEDKKILAMKSTLKDCYFFYLMPIIFFSLLNLIGLGKKILCAKLLL